MECNPFGERPLERRLGDGLARQFLDVLGTAGLGMRTLGDVCLERLWDVVGDGFGDVVGDVLNGILDSASNADCTQFGEFTS